MKMIGAVLMWVACVCGTASAQALWGGAEYGMSVEQAMDAVPEARPIQDGDKLGTGAVERLRVNGIKIAGKEFHAGLFFRESRLDQVSLRISEPLSTGSATAVADRLVEALRAKYGQEISSKSSGGPMITRDYTWISGKTNISLVLAAIGETAQILNVSYQVRVMEDAAKL